MYEKKETEQLQTECSNLELDLQTETSKRKQLEEDIRSLSQRK